eukprot:TRINITY_DN33158_c0_g1_i1.p1 TRINITY_DN33158_c0_g1~~TRINITY_DN33158_c0_g1_i1.p1  ORF type:complete len:434 (-),score=72.90 TRINITY_DN33158_c0_g1_i1:36-1337(-)
MQVLAERKNGSEAFAASSPRRLALLLANGAYTQRAPLSKPVGVAAELKQKLTAMNFLVEGADNQDLAGMKGTTQRWLKQVDSVAESLAEGDAGDASHMQNGHHGRNNEPPLILVFVFAGHGCAGRFFPVDCGKPATPEQTFCFFEDFLFRLFEVLGGKDLFQPKRSSWQRPAGPFGYREEDSPRVANWYLEGVQILVIIESCRRLTGEELKSYEAERTRIAHGKRHLLPCMQAMRPDLAAFGGAEWDAARLAFLSRLGPGAPQLLLALSSESTTPSYDVVFLRSITESLDKPVKLGGILERASMDTLRRTGHKQKPVVLHFGPCDGIPLQDLVLAPSASLAVFQGHPPRPSSLSAASVAGLLTAAVPARRPGDARRSRPPVRAATLQRGAASFGPLRSRSMPAVRALSEEEANQPRSALPLLRRPSRERAVEH